MTTEEATGRLNLYDDPSPLPKTDNINILVDGIRKKREVLTFENLSLKPLR